MLIQWKKMARVPLFLPREGTGEFVIKREGGAEGSSKSEYN